MGSIFKPKTSTQKSTNESSPWQPAQDDLKNILGEIGNWYDSAKDTGYISQTGDLGSIYKDYLSGLSGITDQSQQGVQNLLNQSTQGTTGALTGYQNAATGGLGFSTSDIAKNAEALYDNDMIQKQIAAANQTIDETLKEQAFTGIDRDATASGNMGSSRAGIAQAIASRDAADRKATNANTITANAYNNALSMAGNTLSGNRDSQLAGIGGLANTGSNAMSQAGQYTNSLMSSLAPLLESSQLNQSITAAGQADKIGERDFIANLIQQYYLPTAAGIGGLGGTSTGTSQSPGTSTFNSLLSAGSAAGSIYSAFSDVRLKENIQHTGSHNGINYYKWDWTDEAKAIVGNQGTEGVLAQEVMADYPDAVSMDDSGFLKVDYSKIH